MSEGITRIAVLTSGGDAPGMNAAVRSVVRSATCQGLQVMGIRRGYAGLLSGEFCELHPHSVSETIQKGGTILMTARCKEFETLEGQILAAKILRKEKVEGLVVIGGDGSYRGAAALSEQGIQVIGIPATIDLDIASTDYTIGYDTACNTAMQALDRIRDTSSAHERCSIVEVMGREAGYIAMAAGLSTGVEDILIAETYDGDEDAIINHVRQTISEGKKNHLIVVSEGVGHSQELAKRIEDETGMESRATILGYVQRGGTPTCRDRFMASIMGNHAVELLMHQDESRVVAYRDGHLTDFTFKEALSMTKQIPKMWEVTAKRMEY